MLGVSCDMQKIKKIAKNKSIKILEDNCESVGGKYGKKFLGNVSNIGVLSFDFSKTITTGEGGAILTNNKKLYKFCKDITIMATKIIKSFQGEEIQSNMQVQL